MQLLPITTKVVSLNPAHGEVCSMQLQKKVYVIKFVSDMWQVGGVLGVFSFDNTDCYDITEILLNVVLSTITY